MMKLEGPVLDATGKSVPAYISVMNTTTNQRVYSGRPNTDGSFCSTSWRPAGTKYL